MTEQESIDQHEAMPELNVSALETENELLHQKLEEASLAIAFMENYKAGYHDLRSALASMQSFLNIAEFQEFNIEREEMKEYFGQLSENVAKAINVLDRLEVLKRH